jgi:uncharacterized protein (DUF779 family)
LKGARNSAPLFSWHNQNRSKTMVDKVIATPAALELVARLKQQHGALLFHQSGGCCDNSAANCYLPGELTIGAGDVYLGDIGGCPFYISRTQYAYWKHTQLIIDVIDGHGGTFSLEGPEGKAFHTRSRVFSEEELAQILQQGGAIDPDDPVMVCEQKALPKG